MRSLLVCPLVFGGASAAQTWCPPGATWTFGIDGWGLNGYQVWSYVSDTLVAGLPAQRIDATMYFTVGSNPLDTSHWNTFTAYQDSMVLQWTGAQWDTLFWFGDIGDRWWPIGHPMNCGTMGMVEIMDTSTLVIDGTSFRNWGVDYLDSTGVPMGTSWNIPERLGTPGMLVPIWDCWMIIDYYFFQFLCYSDVDVDVHMTPDTLCAVILGGTEIGPIPGMQIEPNPADDHVTIRMDGWASASRLLIFDARGSLVRNCALTSSEIILDISDQGAGIYTVVVERPSSPTVRSLLIVE